MDDPALVRQRATEVAGHWPALLAGEPERRAFEEWALRHPKVTSYADGLAFARSLEADGALPAPALADLEALRHGTRRGRWPGTGLRWLSPRPR